MPKIRAARQTDYPLSPVWLIVRPVNLAAVEKEGDTG